ncbi:MAG: SUMF1/EgtB/PvdO family nonheme iron enzyme [Candidatus Eisenbacteria bacterium]|nr:SUMF1/EgtB/PvdO family nonheme iron enzyme [Candidatus Eisenbacteria bacterium]
MRSWRIPLLTAGLLVIGVIACTDTEPPPVVDETAPEVALLYPPEIFDDLHRVQDSTHIYIGASDPSGIERVTVYYQRPTDTDPTEIATIINPISFSEVPDTLQTEFAVPDGWSLYEAIWGSSLVRSGTEPQLFAEAVDSKGNRGVSSSVTVIVINTTDLFSPVPDFVITPPQGDTEKIFSFDPSLTEDIVDTDDVIEVRWDFDGDGLWDLGDWDQGQPSVYANEVQTQQYPRNDVYSVRMQARNTYFPQPSDVKVRLLNVTPRGGVPKPPVTMDTFFAEVPAGRYTRGAANPDGASLNELPVHTVNLTNPYRILSREVTNEEYLNYLQVALDSAQVVFTGNEIFAADSTGYRLMDLNNSRIYYNIDVNGFQIEDEYQQHPVTGATWYGANHYAIFYGCRLPTEAEWEVAARGDSLYYIYSFGRTLTEGDPTGTARINYENSGDPFEGNNGTTPTRYYDGTTHGDFETVDTGYLWPQAPDTPSRPAASGGEMIRVYDMSGNVAEWVNDWYGPYTTGVQTNPQGPVTGDTYGNYKVVRGGSYERSADGCRVTARDADRQPDDSFPSIGFRIAYFPQAEEGLRGLPLPFLR